MALGISGWVQPVTVVSGGGTTPVYQTDDWDSNVKNVAVPGTAEQCPSLAAPVGLGIVVKAKSGNEELVYVGSSQANAQNTAKRVSLAAGQAIILYVENANLVWVDAVAAGEGVETAVEQE